MMMPTGIMVAMVVVTAVSTAFGLERHLHSHKLRSEAMEHLLDHMIGPNAKDLAANFGRQMSISQMPGQAHELAGFLVPDFDDIFRSGLDLQQPPVFELQRIAVGHRNGVRKVEENVFTLIGSQANAAAMARVKVESKRACGRLLWPISGRPMNCRIMHRHLST
jgi:hypothetical protein